MRTFVRFVLHLLDQNFELLFRHIHFFGECFNIFEFFIRQNAIGQHIVKLVLDRLSLRL